MNTSILQFLLEMNFCLLIYIGLYFFLEKKKVNASFLFYIVSFIPLLSVLIPLFDFSLPLEMVPAIAGNTELIVSKSAFVPLAVSYSGNIILTLNDIFSLIYFLGFAYFGFRYADRLFKNNFIKKMPIYKKIISEIPALFLIIHWFSPLSHLIKKKQNRLSIKLSNKIEIPFGNKNILTFFSMAICSIMLFALFSFNLSSNIPLASTYTKVDSSFQELREYTLFDLEKTRKGTVLDWGNFQLSINQIQEDAKIPQKILIPIMNRPYFKEIKDAELRFYKKGEKQRIVGLEAIFNSPDFEEPLLAHGREEFQKYIQAVASQREVSIFVKIITDLGEEWTTAIAISRYNKLYDENVNFTDFLASNPLLQYELNTELKPYFLVEEGSDNVEEVEAIYMIKWGEMKIILEKIANPNIYSGNLKLSIEDFEKNTSNKIEILKNGKTQGFTDFQLQQIEPDNQRNKLPFKYEKEEEIYSLNIDDFYLKDWKEGTTFSIAAKTKDIRISYSSLQIINPYALYASEMYVKKVSIEEPEYTFQVINLPNKKTSLKVDTTLSQNQKYLEMYSNSANYDIIHIPNFKTNRRAISDDDFIWLEEKEEKIQGQLDILSLPEYIDHIGKPLALTWGKILANPGSVGYNREDIIKNNHAPLKIRIDDHFLDLEQFEIIVQHKEEQPIIHKIQRKKGEFRLPDFSEIDTETSIFFQKIVVFHEGKFQFFPVNFAFYIGKELNEYELTIEETTEYGERLDSIFSTEGVYEIVWKNSNIKEVFSDYFQTHEIKIRFSGAQKNPKLNIHYFSKKMNNLIGNSLILNELRKRYRFSFSSNFETLPSYRLGIRYEDRLNNFIVSEEKKKIASPNSCRNGDFDILESATMGDLTDFIQSRFNKYITLTSSNDNAYYFALDTSSIETLILQLETDYGIQLVKGEYSVPFIDVVFVK